jgi:hypothetical protein
VQFYSNGTIIYFENLYDLLNTFRKEQNEMLLKTFIKKSKHYCLKGRPDSLSLLKKINKIFWFYSLSAAMGTACF